MMLHIKNKDINGEKNTLDEHGIILSINKYGADLLGYPISTLIGKPILDITHVDDGRIIMQKLKLCVSDPNRVQ